MWTFPVRPPSGQYVSSSQKAIEAVFSGPNPAALQQDTVEGFTLSLMESKQRNRNIDQRKSKWIWGHQTEGACILRLLRSSSFRAFIAHRSLLDVMLSRQTVIKLLFAHRTIKDIFHHSMLRMITACLHKEQKSTSDAEQTIKEKAFSASKSSILLK